ncbi:MAG: NAD(P)H-hydrate dehydratase [Phycisphaerales bacterium]
MTTLESSPLPRLPARDPRGHKGTFGTVAVFGGCAHDDRHMLGAAALAATAALRAGAGLARLVMPAPILDAALTICPSATGVPMPVDAAGRLVPHEASAVIDEQVRVCDALVIGPGLGASEGARAASLRAVQQEHVPVIVDADALNMLAEVPELTRDFRAAAVLTPHPGEFLRLAGSLGIAHDPTDASSRPRAAEALAQRLGCIVVLKGAGTIVSDGQRTWVNTSGHAALATAGTGDVLAGLIAGLAAQFVAGPARGAPARPLDLYDAARLGVFAHGLAGEAWASARRAAAGLLALELADEIPAVLDAMRRGDTPRP